MSVEADIVTALQSILPGRVFPDVAPGNAAKPYAVYQQVGGEAVNFVEKALPSLKNGRFQVSVWGDTRLAVSAIALQLESALVRATAFDARPISAPLADYDEQTSLRGSRQDFNIWSAR